MRRKTKLRLSLMFTIIATVLCCLFLVTPPKTVQATFASCATCEANHNTALTQCDISRETCRASCAPGDSICTSACDNAWNQCRFSAGMNETDCFLTCVPGGGGGGTGGGLTKTPCVNACYAARLQCFGNHGIPDAEECINEGNSYAVCCYNAFQECLAGC